jgi:hypothetical protein
MLIYVKIIKKKTFYGRTTQNYSSEPDKKKLKILAKKILKKKILAKKVIP